MLSRTQKERIVKELKERFQKQRISLFANFSGISVAKLARFRRELKKIGAEFKVAKKTLLGRAFEAAGVGLEAGELRGEVGIIFGYEDQAAPAKAAAKFAKENKGFRILKGLLENKPIDGEGAASLARLPSREELLGELARALNSPLQSLVNVLQGNIRNLVVVLNRVKSKKE